MPKVSIIIPVYNTEKDLPKCLDSLVNQTLDDIEILIVNDGSTDSSQKIIDDYVSRYPGIIKAFSKENGGQSSARNLAIGHASGEYIAFVDSDDYVELFAYETAYNAAKEKDLDILCFDYWVVNNGGINYCDHCVIKDVEVDKKFVLNESSPCNKIIKRTLLTDNNIRFVENYIYEDFEMIPRLVLYTKKIGYIEKALYFYMIREGSTMNQKKYSPKLASIYFVMESLRKHFEGTKYTCELEYLFIDQLMYFATFRYLDYPEGIADIKKISDIMRKHFPKWSKNIYYKRKPFKQKVFLWLVYLKQIGLLKRLLKK